MENINPNKILDPKDNINSILVNSPTIELEIATELPYIGIKYLKRLISLPPVIVKTPATITTIYRGEIYAAASFVFLAYVAITVISATSRNAIESIITPICKNWAIDKLISGPFPLLTVFGMTIPRARVYIADESIEIIVSPRSLPKTISSLFIGAKSKLAIVPLSFSPVKVSIASPIIEEKAS